MTEPEPQPQPVVWAAHLAGLANGAFVACSGLVFWFKDGSFTQGNLAQTGNLIALAVTAVLAVVSYVSTVLHGKAAAKVVTPLSRPMDEDGNRLVPAQTTFDLITADRSASMGPDLPANEGTASSFAPPGQRRRLADGSLSGALSPPLSAPACEPTDGSTSAYPDPESYAEELDRKFHEFWAEHGKHDDTEEIPAVTYRFGRKPNSGKPRVSLTADLIPAAVYSPPASVDYYSKVPASTWGMDGNDTVGDCTCAEVDHTTKARQVAAGNTEVKSSASEVLKLYSEVTGYTPSNPNSDQGAEMQAVRNYWRKNGAVLGGKTHKLLLFAEIDHTDHKLVQWCIDQFGAVGVGFNFPDSAMTQFNEGKPWDVVKGAAAPTEGHAVSAIGYDDTYVYALSWARVQKMTWAFWDKYVEEAWTDLDDSFVNAATGNDALGQVAYELGQQFEAVTGQANPFPAPAPAPVPPAPAPAPGPAPAPSIPASWVAWATHTLTLKEQSRATVEVAKEIIAAAGK